MSEKSGFYYPNLMSRIYMQALEEVMGKSGVNALLNLATLPELIGNYPPANLDREFDFSDFSAIGRSLEEMYGPRGGLGLGVRAGRAAFAEGLSKFGATAGVADLAFKVLPTGTKLKVGLKAMAAGLMLLVGFFLPWVRIETIPEDRLEAIFAQRPYVRLFAIEGAAAREVEIDAELDQRLIDLGYTGD